MTSANNIPIPVTFPVSFTGTTYDMTASGSLTEDNRHISVVNKTKTGAGASRYSGFGTGFVVNWIAIGY